MDILEGINTPELGSFGISLFLKIFLFLIFAADLLYLFLLSLRVRILADTVETPFNGYAKSLVIFNVLITLFLGLVGVTLVILS